MVFEVGDQVLLIVWHWRELICFGKREKLNSWYTIPLNMLKHVRKQAYRLELSQELLGIHKVFHVFYLQK